MQLQYIIFTILILVTLYLWVATLKELRKAQIDELSRVIWSIFVTFVPIIDPIVVLIVYPGYQSRHEQSN